MTDPLCAELERHAADLAAGDLPSPRADRLAAHVRSCGRCARTLAAERRLQAELASLPAGSGPPPVPRLPDRIPGPVIPVRWGVAAAAAAVLAAVVVARSLAPDADGDGREVAAAAYRIVDAGISPPGWDDPLLALTTSAEVVAARRPAEGR